MSQDSFFFKPSLFEFNPTSSNDSCEQKIDHPFFVFRVQRWSAIIGIWFIEPGIFWRHTYTSPLRLNYFRIRIIRISGCLPQALLVYATFIFFSLFYFFFFLNTEFGLPKFCRIFVRKFEHETNFGHRSKKIIYTNAKCYLLKRTQVKMSTKFDDEIVESATFRLWR